MSLVNPPPPAALDRAVRKARLRLLPLLFACYVIAYVDRTNVSIAKLTMSKDMPEFTNAVIGFGAGIFFLGYFLLEIPGTLLVEKWSARKWISRIMITWGIVAALTAFVKTPFQFYTARFFLGLAEAGFFPGVIVYVSHWFPSRERAKALAWFLIATPIAQMISPKICNFMLKIGTTEEFQVWAWKFTVHHPELWGLEGWQWIYIAWGIPAVILGVLVFFYLTDRPRHAKWLTDEERQALEDQLSHEKSLHPHMRVIDALKHPKVLMLAAAYFFIVTGNYGVEIFLPSILDKWYKESYDVLTWALMIPPIGSLLGQRFVGWSSDRTGERRLHTAIPIYIGALFLSLTVLTRGSNVPFWPFAVMVLLFTVAATGLKAYLPAFWTLPTLFLTEAAAAGSIGLINSVGNLGGFVGPFVLGYVESRTGSFLPGILFLSVSMVISATIILRMGLGHAKRASVATVVPSNAEPTTPADAPNTPA
jgi:ACS family tartrate transporter-like MFS transporter